MRTKLRNRKKILLDIRFTQNIIKFESGITRFKSSKSYISDRDIITISNHDIFITTILRVNREVLQVQGDVMRGLRVNYLTRLIIRSLMNCEVGL